MQDRLAREWSVKVKIPMAPPVMKSVCFWMMPDTGTHWNAKSERKSRSNDMPVSSRDISSCKTRKVKRIPVHIEPQF